MQIAKCYCYCGNQWPLTEQEAAHPFHWCQRCWGEARVEKIEVPKIKADSLKGEMPKLLRFRSVKGTQN